LTKASLVQGFPRHGVVVESANGSLALGRPDARLGV
jgi:hypothetical protein